MGRKYNYLTKSKITSGLQCQKKLWFDVHNPIKKDKAVFTNNDGVKETHTAKFDRKGNVKKNTVKVKGKRKVVTRYAKGGLVQYD